MDSRSDSSGKGAGEDSGVDSGEDSGEGSGEDLGRIWEDLGIKKHNFQLLFKVWGRSGFWGSPSAFAALGRV